MWQGKGEKGNVCNMTHRMKRNLKMQAQKQEPGKQGGRAVLVVGIIC